MASRKKILPGFLLEKKHGTDLYGEVLRETVAGKRFEGPEFFAKVLSAPYPMDPVTVTDFFPAPGFRTTTEEGIMTIAELEAKYAKLRDKPSKFSFFGRIESQHKMLPEPSVLTFSTAPELTLNVIKDHTEFISTFGAEPPVPGDLVIVRLREGDNGWNLQRGEYIELFESGWDPEYAAAQFTAVQNKGIQDPIDLWLEEDFGPTDEEIAAGAAIHATFEEALAEEGAATAGPITGPDGCLPTNPIPCYQMNGYRMCGSLVKQEDGTYKRQEGSAEELEARKQAYPEIYGATAHWWDKSSANLCRNGDAQALKFIVIHNTGTGRCVEGGTSKNESKNSMNEHWVQSPEWGKHCKGTMHAGTTPPCAGKGWSKDKQTGLYKAYCCPGAVSWHYGVDQLGNISQGILDQDMAYTTGNYNAVQIGIEINGSAIPTEEDFKSVENWVELWGNGDETEALKQIRYRVRPPPAKHCTYEVKNSGDYNCGRTGMYNDIVLDALSKLVHDLCVKYGIPMQRGIPTTKYGRADDDIPGIVGHDEIPEAGLGDGHLAGNAAHPLGKCLVDPYACRKFDPGTRLTLKPGVPKKTRSGQGYQNAAFDWDDFIKRVNSYGAPGPALAAFGAASGEETSEA